MDTESNLLTQGIEHLIAITKGRKYFGATEDAPEGQLVHDNYSGISPSLHIVNDPEEPHMIGP
jgi:hypothetical protein